MTPTATSREHERAESADLASDAAAPTSRSQVPGGGYAAQRAALSPSARPDVGTQRAALAPAQSGAPAFYGGLAFDAAAARDAVSRARPGGLPHARQIEAETGGAVDAASLPAAVVPGLPGAGVALDGRIAVRPEAGPEVARHEAAHVLGADEAGARRAEADPGALTRLAGGGGAAVDGWSGRPAAELIELIQGDDDGFAIDFEGLGDRGTLSQLDELLETGKLEEARKLMGEIETAGGFSADEAATIARVIAAKHGQGGWYAAEVRAEARPREVAESKRAERPLAQHAEEEDDLDFDGELDLGALVGAQPKKPEADHALPALDGLNPRPIPAPARGELVPATQRACRAMHPGRPGTVGLAVQHLDILGQTVSDALMFVAGTDADEARVADLVVQKAKLVAATVLVDQLHYAIAFERGADVVKGHFTAALHAVQRLNWAAFDWAIFHADKVVPKTREQDRPVDVASAALARTVLGNEEDRDDPHRFTPDLVVGLPTGGAHVATRFAAAQGMLTGQNPMVWQTRPHARKKESVALMNGVGEDSMLTRAEVAFLADALRKDSGGAAAPLLRIFIADDGMAKGESLDAARKLYQKAFEGAGFRVDLRTGVATGVGNREGSELPMPDYQVSPNQDVAGPQRVLDRASPGAQGSAMKVNGITGKTIASSPAPEYVVSIVRQVSGEEVVDLCHFGDLLNPELTKRVKVSG